MKKWDYYLILLQECAKSKSIEKLYKNGNPNHCSATHNNMNMLLLWDNKVVGTIEKPKYSDNTIVESTEKPKCMNIFYRKVVKHYKPNTMTTNNYYIIAKFYLVGFYLVGFTKIQN